MTISIIVPVYNEAKSLVKSLERISQLHFHDAHKEIIVVDDGSTDRSRELMLQAHKLYQLKIYFHEENRGKGAALRTGYAHATGDIIAIQDADLEYNPDELKKLVRPIIDGKADVVYGSRMTSDNPKGYWYMYAGNFFVSLVAQLLYGSKLTDVETCYKVFRKDVLNNIRLVSDGFDIEAEFTAKVLRKGYRIKELPISYTPRAYDEGKKISWKDGVRAVWLLMKYRIYKKKLL